MKRLHRQSASLLQPYLSEHKFSEPNLQKKKKKKRMHETLSYVNKKRTGCVPFTDSPHFKLHLQSVLSYGSNNINHNVNGFLKYFWNPKAREEAKKCYHVNKTMFCLLKGLKRKEEKQIKGQSNVVNEPPLPSKEKEGRKLLSQSEKV